MNIIVLTLFPNFHFHIDGVYSREYIKGIRLNTQPVFSEYITRTLPRGGAMACAITQIQKYGR